MRATHGIHAMATCDDASVSMTASNHYARSAAMNSEDLQKLATRTMPFGKYEGRLIADLPGPYLAWFARQGFPQGEIGRLLALMHEIDHNGLNALLEPLH